MVRFEYQRQGGRDGRRFWLVSVETMSFPAHRLLFLPEPLHQVCLKQTGVFL